MYRKMMSLVLEFDIENQIKMIESLKNNNKYVYQLQTIDGIYFRANLEDGFATTRKVYNG